MLYHGILGSWAEGYVRDPPVLTFLRKDSAWGNCTGILSVEYLSCAVLLPLLERKVRLCIGVFGKDNIQKLPQGPGYHSFP